MNKLNLKNITEELLDSFIHAGKVAQEIADQLVDCGVKSILNFAPVLLKNIPDVQIRSVDLSQELQILSYYLDRPVLKAVK